MSAGTKLIDVNVAILVILVVGVPFGAEGGKGMIDPLTGSCF